MNRIIEIIVSPSGQTKIETKGFVGAECRNSSRFLENALGQLTDELLKAEFHQTISQQQQAQQRE
ncbi:DUF2997 domain-containing protein [uncultured Rubinisphaera sp.]|uniref:DUF2997 domain-containing protein n=1 Tax=uncultured Rubinisphaera sp. TaxID=1678686 RepID=UPI000ECDEAB7|nr:hypothetical protein [Planctomycetaceae bacterium]